MIPCFPSHRETGNLLMGNYDDHNDTRLKIEDKTKDKCNEKTAENIKTHVKPMFGPSSGRGRKKLVR